MTEWKVGPVLLGTDQGRFVAPGWVNDRFGIDCRYDADGDWALVVTHLKTGFIIAALAESLETTKYFAERIGDLGDWDFNDPAEAKAYGEGVKEARSGLSSVKPSELLFGGAVDVLEVAA